MNNNKNFLKIKKKVIRTSKQVYRGLHTQDQYTKTYTSNQQSENGIKKTIPCTITSKRIKILGINLTKVI